MEPGRTSKKHVFFSRFDLAPHLRKGANVIAASLGNGWEASDGNQPGSTQQAPGFYLDATITLRANSDDASVGAGIHTPIRVVTNSSWSSGLGAVTYNSVYQGERRDLRLSTPGWQSSGFDASGWRAAELATTDKLLLEQTRPAVVELMVLHARSLRKINVSTHCDGAPGCHDSVRLPRSS